MLQTVKNHFNSDNIPLSLGGVSPNKPYTPMNVWEKSGLNVLYGIRGTKKRHSRVTFQTITAALPKKVKFSLSRK